MVVVGFGSVTMNSTYDGNIGGLNKGEWTKKELSQGFL